MQNEWLIIVSGNFALIKVVCETVFFCKILLKINLDKLIREFFLKTSNPCSIPLI